MKLSDFDRMPPAQKKGPPPKSKVKIKVRGRRAQLAAIRKLKDSGNKKHAYGQFQEAIEDYEDCIELFTAMKNYYNDELKS